MTTRIYSTDYSFGFFGVYGTQAIALPLPFDFCLSRVGAADDVIDGSGKGMVDSD